MEPPAWFIAPGVSRIHCGPFRQQIPGVHRSDSGCKIPTGVSGISGLIDVVERGQDSIRIAGGLETIDEQSVPRIGLTSAVIVALRDVVEDANVALLGHGVRVAVGGAAGEIEFSLRQRVVNGVGVSPPAAGFLIDEGLNSGHDGGRYGRAAPTGPRVRSARASESTSRIGPARGVVRVPETIRREQRDIGNIANTIARVTQNAALPGRLGVARAGSAHHSAECGPAHCASTGAAAAAHRAEQETERATPGDL